MTTPIDGPASAGTPQLAERSWRSTAPRAVLLHGSSSSSGTWWRVGPALAERGWSVRALDLPGHGTSPRGAGPLPPGMLADAVEEALGDAPLDLLVGHSLGALVALELAARAPQRVRRLVLEEPPGPLSMDFPAMAEVLEESARAAREDLDAMVAELRAGFPRWHETDCRQAACDLVACDVPAAAAGLLEGPAWRTVALAEAVACPTLVLLAPDADGRYDDRVDGSALRRAERRDFTDRLGAGDVRVLDAGHCIHRDDPSGWMAAVSAFCAEATPAAELRGAPPRDASLSSRPTSAGSAAAGTSPTPSAGSSAPE